MFILIIKDHNKLCFGNISLFSDIEKLNFMLVTFGVSQERKFFDEKFVKTDTDRLLELISAAHSLELRSLVDLISRAVARVIEGRSNEEIREIFHVPDDLAEVIDFWHLLCLLEILLNCDNILGGETGTSEKSKQQSLHPIIESTSC